ncbi:MAG: hypothetical protein U1F77_14490 [Kiritimatiellia bacterium]
MHFHQPALAELQELIQVVSRSTAPVIVATPGEQVRHQERAPNPPPATVAMSACTTTIVATTPSTNWTTSQPVRRRRSPAG